MPPYRVSYVESTLREAWIAAESKEQAEELVREEVENCRHHHVKDFWTDDWRVETLKDVANKPKPSCQECGGA